MVGLLIRERLRIPQESNVPVLGPMSNPSSLSQSVNGLSSPYNSARFSA